MANSSPEMNHRAVLIAKILDPLTETMQSLPKPQVKISSQPEADSHRIAKQVANRIGKNSLFWSAAPGPWGLLTILPDLHQGVTLQKQMVVDIAALYGVEHQLQSAAAVTLMFGGGGIKAVETIAVDIALKKISTRAGQRIVQETLKRFAIKLTQRTIGNIAKSYLPVVGAVGSGLIMRQSTLVIAHRTIKVCALLARQNASLSIIQSEGFSEPILAE